MMKYHLYSLLNYLKKNIMNLSMMKLPNILFVVNLNDYLIMMLEHILKIHSTNLIGKYQMMFWIYLLNIAKEIPV